MSTHAVFIFKDETHDGREREFYVYKQSDCYPSGESGAIASILKAFKYAWELPRFEPGEFAAAFVAVNKNTDGEVYLSEGPKYHGGLDYCYEIEQVLGTLRIRVIPKKLGGTTFYGTLEEAIEKFVPKDAILNFQFKPLVV